MSLKKPRGKPRPGPAPRADLAADPANVLFGAALRKLRAAARAIDAFRRAGHGGKCRCRWCGQDGAADSARDLAALRHFLGQVLQLGEQVVVLTRDELVLRYRQSAARFGWAVPACLAARAEGGGS
jgi:hypothetical protein